MLQRNERANDVFFYFNALKTPIQPPTHSLHTDRADCTALAQIPVPPRLLPAKPDC
jgi:hypothetical protein